jgi:Ohr subfamily peroxiredoxin
MIQLEKVLYTAKAHMTGGRDGGTSRASDGWLDVKLSTPGITGTGTNPQQLFAAGWSACYLSAIKLIAGKTKVSLPNDTATDAEVDLGPAGKGYALVARLKVSLPGVDQGVAQRLLEAAHEVCPYSRATHGNIEGTTTLATELATELS